MLTLDFNISKGFTDKYLDNHGSKFSTYFSIKQIYVILFWISRSI